MEESLGKKKRKDFTPKKTMKAGSVRKKVVSG